MTDWENHYRNQHHPWDRGDSSPALDHWLADGSLAPGRILIPGCGRGHEAVDLARRGFQVTALDIAPTALAHLERQLEKAGVTAERVCDDALTWRPASPFDAIYEQSCLCAPDPGHWSAYEAQLQAWLKPGGKLFALFMQTGKDGGPPYHCDMAAMDSLFPAQHWHWEGTPHREVPHPNGHFEYAAVLTRL